MERSWILVGMMGSGKSTVGKLLAEKAGRTFEDTDQLIVRKLGRPINQLFSIYGQEAFRDHESSVLKSLEPGASVIATGGGIVLREANWTEMRRLGLVAYLKLDLDQLVCRLERSSRKRPLLEVDDWPVRLGEILRERESIYEKADIVVALESEDHDQAADRLLAEFSRQP